MQQYIKKKVKRLQWVLPFSNYCQEAQKQKQKTKIKQTIKNNRKLKAMKNIKPIMDR